RFILCVNARVGFCCNANNQMGNCLRTNAAKSKYADGDPITAETATNSPSDAEEATAMLSGPIAYSRSCWVELSVQCTQLQKRDYCLSKPDPLGVLYQLTNGMWSEFGRTEVIANTHDPEFSQVFRMMFDFELSKKFRIVLIDVSNAGQQQDPDNVHPDSC
ncbi:hypothetical protein Vretimale_4524, partial [Volvox reticuliferus]